jgi:hypothetical protein
MHGDLFAPENAPQLVGRRSIPAGGGEGPPALPGALARDCAAVLGPPATAWVGQGVDPGTAWQGSGWLHLPASAAAVAALCDAYAAGRIRACVAVTRAATDQLWFARLAVYPHLFVRGRLRFGGYRADAPYASLVVYLGPDAERFRSVFAGQGVFGGPTGPAVSAAPAPEKNPPAGRPTIRECASTLLSWLKGRLSGC